jgi:hypothetical protein
MEIRKNISISIPIMGIHFHSQDWYRLGCVAHTYLLMNSFIYNTDINTVAYLLKVRTVKAGKELLLGNGPYTRSRGTRSRTL